MGVFKLKNLFVHVGWIYQCFKLKFSRSRLLATSFCEMVAARKILVAKKETVFKAGHLMSLYMK